METIWFLIVAFMLTAYVVLDGFDLGAGIIHYLVGRSPDERRLNLSAIGPVWDGNEVWLLAAGGTLYFAFPALYAASFSGFYLPLMMVLWLLILRATGIELRHQLDNSMWHSFWDFLFSASSILLAIFFGAALGNVIRGVPLNSDGFFFEPLWTNFGISENNGILDWYTVLTGVVALVALSVHGAAWTAAKTEGEMQERARKITDIVWYALVGLTILSLIATLGVRPQILDNYRNYPIGWLIPIIAATALGGIKFYNQRGKDWQAFFSSALYLVGMLGGAAFGLYPNVLPASGNTALSLTVHNAKAGDYGLQIGLVWWSLGIALALVYFTFLYRSFGGKVNPDEH